MEVEVALGNDLEQRFAIKIDLVVLRVGLIVNVRVSESFRNDEPLGLLAWHSAHSMKTNDVSPFDLLLSL